MPTYRLFLSLCIAALAGAFAPVAAQTDVLPLPAAPSSSNSPIDLKLDPPDKAGYASEQVTDLTSTYTYHYMRLGTLLKTLNATTAEHADLIQRIVAVNEDGQATKFRVYVKSLTAKLDIPAPLSRLRKNFPPPADIRCQGATVIINTDPKVTLARVDGVALTTADIDYLHALYHPLHIRPLVTAFDPDHPVGVGDSWNPDSSAVAAVVAEGVTVSPEDVTCTASLDSRSPYLGVDCAVITIQVKAENITDAESDQIADDATSTFDSTRTVTVPIDGSPVLAINLTTVGDWAGLYKAPRLEGVEMDMHIVHNMDGQTLRILH